MEESNWLKFFYRAVSRFNLKDAEAGEIKMGWECCS